MNEVMKAYGLDVLPKSSRLWIFQSSRLMTDTLFDQVSGTLDEFIAQWAAHGRQLFAGFEIKHDRFIVIAVDQNHEAASGCSIDSMMRCVQQVDADFQLNLLDRMKVAYLDGAEVKEAGIQQFREMWGSGRVNGETRIFNNTISTLAELENSWLVPVNQSWLINAL